LSEIKTCSDLCEILIPVYTHAMTNVSYHKHRKDGVLLGNYLQ